MLEQFVATIGMFDGVHTGHQYVLRHLNDYAHAHGLESMVVSFAQHPSSVLTKEHKPLLTTLTEKQQLLEQFGASHVLIFDFAHICSLTARQFLHLLHTEYGVSALLLGYNHRFGSDRLSRFADYRSLGEEEGVEVVCLDEYSLGNTHVSSTVIRRLILSGDIESANRLLGHLYSLSGRVVHGKAIGRNIGFPTANLSLDNDFKLIPPDGVYAAQVGSHPAVLNIGTNPTLGQNERTIEVHIIDFSDNIYNRSITVMLRKRIRSEHKFDSLSSLQHQIEADIEEVRRLS